MLTETSSADDSVMQYRGHLWDEVTILNKQLLTALIPSIDGHLACILDEGISEEIHITRHSYIHLYPIAHSAITCH